MGTFGQEKRLIDEQDRELYDLYVPHKFGYRKVAEKFNQRHPEIADVDHSLVRNAVDRVQRKIDADINAAPGEPSTDIAPVGDGIDENSLGKWVKSEDELLAKSGGAALEILATMRDTSRLIKKSDSSLEKKRLAETMELMSKTLSRVHESGRTIAGEPTKRTESTSTTIVVDAAKLADIAGRAKELGARSDIIDVDEA